MGKVIQVWANNKEIEKLDNFIQIKNVEVYPAKLYLSTFLKELALKYIENWERERTKKSK